MTLRDHLEELRRRLTVVAVVVVVAVTAAFAFHDQVLAWLLAPGFGKAGLKPVFTEATELIGVTMKVSLMAGLVLALPVVLFQVVRFVAPALTFRERIYLYALIPGVLVAFAGGVAFGYYVVLPPAFAFLFTFGTEHADPYIRISSYINLITNLMFWMGVVFEIPIVMFMLGRLGVVNARMLSRFRRWALLLAFVAGAMITPTFDPVNQSLVAVPVMVLYEAGILLARLGGLLRRRAA